MKIQNYKRFILNEDLKGNNIIHGIYDPDYEDYGIVLFNDPKKISDFNSDTKLKKIVPYLKDAVVLTGKDFKEKYIEFKNKKLQKVIYTKKLNLGSNLGEGEYWCATNYCIDIYSGETPDSKMYAKYFHKIIEKDLPNDFNILVKPGFVDDIRFG
jgi:hypothetical protein